MKSKPRPKVKPSDHLPRLDSPRAGWINLGNGGRKRPSTSRDQ